MKTSWRRLSSSSSEDVLIKMNMFALALHLQKTSSRRLGQDQYIRLGHTSSRRLQDVLQKRLQDIFKTFSRRIIKLKCSCPANIRLDEDVLKTSFVFVFRRRLQDVLIKTNMFALALRLQKCLQDIFKTSSRRFEDVFKTSSRRLAKISSRRFQDVSSS